VHSSDFPSFEMVKHPFGTLKVSISKHDTKLLPTSYTCYIPLYDKIHFDATASSSVSLSSTIYMVDTMVYSVYCKGLCLGLLQWMY
jgi:hypothetical protein